VDVIVAETDYQQIARARASDGHISVEDVIVHKLIAWRGRDQDGIRFHPRGRTPTRSRLHRQMGGRVGGLRPLG
jgi:hypothetical protein